MSSIYSPSSGPIRTIDPMTGSGWASFTPLNGESTTWGTGKLTLSTPSGVTAGDGCGAYKAILVSGEEYDVAVRAKITAGNTDANMTFNLTVGVDSSSHRFYAQMRFDGSLQSGGFAGGGWVAVLGLTAANTISSGDRTGGQLWLRVRRRDSEILYYTGVGAAGAVPTTWTLRASTVDTSLLGTGTRGGLVVTVSTDSGPGASAAISTIEALDIRIAESVVAL